MPDSTPPGADRRCQAGPRCVEYDRARQVAPLLHPDSPPLCPDCLRVAERDVRALPADYVALEQLVPPSISQWSDGAPIRSSPGELPLPVRQYILVLQRTMWWVATAWEPVVRELDQLTPERRKGVREGWALQQAVTVIAPRLPQLARVGPVDMADYPPIDETVTSAIVWGPDRTRYITHTTPTGVDGILHMRRLHSLAIAATGLTRRIRRVPGSCHECLRDGTLRQNEPAHHRDDPPVWCDVCGAWRPYDEYERLIRLLVWQGEEP